MSQVQPGTNLKTTSRWPWIALTYVAIAVGVGVTLVITWPSGEYQSVLRINNTMIRLLDDHAAPCQPPRWLDNFWHVDLEGLQGKCAAYDDRYRTMAVLSDSSSYRCRYGNGWDQPSPLPQFRVLGERHSGTNGAS